MHKDEMSAQECIGIFVSSEGMNATEFIELSKSKNLEEDERVRAIATIAGVTAEQFAISLKGFAEAISVMADAFMKAFGWVKELSDFITQFDFNEINHIRKSRKMLYKLDFSRPRIQHQVVNRKPRYLIKKIIH